MSKIKKECIRKARAQFKIIYPCGDRPTFYECFTEFDNKVIFWFNTEDKSTRCVELSIAA